MMKAFVLTIEDIEQSQQAAHRCIKTGKAHGVDIQKHFGFTPKDNPLKILEEKGLPLTKFKEKWSRLESCVAAFLGHRSLWEKCAEGNDSYLILEHDAVFDSSINAHLLYTQDHDIVSVGAPSYGKFNTPMSLGIGPLVSKPYFPGAHAYILTPKGAKEALRVSMTEAGPTDVFFNLNNFPNLKEFYPWPVRANDSFTTIQKTEGCLAKHNWNEGVGYDIV